MESPSHRGRLAARTVTLALALTAVAGSAPASDQKLSMGVDVEMRQTTTLSRESNLMAILAKVYDGGKVPSAIVDSLNRLAAKDGGEVIRAQTEKLINGRSTKLPIDPAQWPTFFPDLPQPVAGTGSEAPVCRKTDKNMKAVVMPVGKQVVLVEASGDGKQSQEEATRREVRIRRAGHDDTLCVLGVTLVEGRAKKVTFTSVKGNTVRTWILGGAQRPRLPKRGEVRRGSSRKEHVPSKP